MPLSVIEDPAEMQRRSLALARDGLRVALVPTMGALHEGHLTLVREAAARADHVIVSIFVNPAQFGANEDLSAYPRRLGEDCDRVAEAGAHTVFTPTEASMYPEGFQTRVRVEEISRPLCGEHRPVHFGGVATVVMKLFQICQPRVAVFGWKDAQQFILLCRMVRDMMIPVEMIGVETVREPDGLAMSSRNEYLSPAERAEAPAIRRGLVKLRDAAAGGRDDAAGLLALARGEIEACGAIRVQYLEMRSLDRLEPLDRVEPGNTLVAVAAHLGKTRLIDNIRL